MQIGDLVTRPGSGSLPRSHAPSRVEEILPASGYSIGPPAAEDRVEISPMAVALLRAAEVLEQEQAAKFAGRGGSGIGAFGEQGGHSFSDNPRDLAEEVALGRGSVYGRGGHATQLPNSPRERPSQGGAATSRLAGAHAPLDDEFLGDSGFPRSETVEWVRKGYMQGQWSLDAVGLAAMHLVNPILARAFGYVAPVAATFAGAHGRGPARRSATAAVDLDGYGMAVRQNSQAHRRSADMETKVQGAQWFSA